MSPDAYLNVASVTLNRRSDDYDEHEELGKSIADNWNAIAEAASQRLGKHLTAREVIEIMICLKEHRIKVNPGHMDSHVDRIAYTAIAAALAEREHHAITREDNS